MNKRYLCKFLSNIYKFRYKNIRKSKRTLLILHNYISLNKRGENNHSWSQAPQTRPRCLRSGVDDHAAPTQTLLITKLIPNKLYITIGR